MTVVILLILWAVVSLLLWDGPRHMNGYDLIRSSEASWNKGKGRKLYICLSVYFLNRGNWYYYLTEDPSVRPNDIVVVPWGKNDHQELAIVGWVEQRNVSQRWCRDERGKALLVHNEPEERRKLKAWIRENPRLKIIEPISDLDFERTRFMHG